MKEGDAERRCGRCGEMKPLEAFAWRRKAKGQRHNMCRPCHSQYHHEHYSANKARYVQQARERKQALARERTAWLLTYFESHPCADCSETDPVVLEFDHRRDKKFNIGNALAYRRWETILTEIAKCDVVCANCHRRRTARRLGSVRSVLASAPRLTVTGAGRESNSSPRAWTALPGPSAEPNPRWRAGQASHRVLPAQPVEAWLHEPNRIHRRHRRRSQRGAGRARDDPVVPKRTTGPPASRHEWSLRALDAYFSASRRYEKGRPGPLKP